VRSAGSRPTPLASATATLERHQGEDRVVTWPRVPVSVAADEAWRRVLGPDGLGREGSVSGLKAGDPYGLTAASGDVFAGRVLVNDPPYEFAGTVEALPTGF